MSRALFCPSFRGLEAAMSLPISEGPLLPKVLLQQACALAPATHLLATRPRPHSHRPCACSGPQQTAQSHFQLAANCACLRGHRLPPSAPAPPPPTTRFPHVSA